MTTYRTGNHHGITIVAEGDGARCGRPDHDCERGHLVAVVVDGGEEFAERICTLLNGEARTHVESSVEDWDWQAPETAPASTESAQEPSAGGAGRAEAAEAISGPPIPDSGIGASIVFLDDREDA